ncbi:MAG TPA: NADP-dependent malic enzyme [Acholeplasmataceae bacterium]|jgi:malate dehydrogenase (oxaloacetate-decarboxylating)|nr:NADP-dependent malic enzyme [Acholeplasmataceae bacterium]
MADFKEKVLNLHEKYQGKIEITSKLRINSKEDLALVYSPGVAEASLAIKENKEDVYKYTSKGKFVAIVTDGSAVLGLGDIGPEAALPVMEGKALLFKKFAGVDAFPICLKTKDVDEIVNTVKLIAPGFGGVNLEDISFPRCVEIEERLKKELDIPVFHDDQHGTAIVTLAALINACKVVGKKLENLKVVISGFGAAGSAIARLLRKASVPSIYATNRRGVLSKLKENDPMVDRFLEKGIVDSYNKKDGKLEDIIKDADVFIGVSVADVLTKEMVNMMADKPIVFALANPNPEISSIEVKKTKAYIYATGRSDLPNQINNVLAFPGLFKGVFACKAKQITEEMLLDASHAIASLITKEELSKDYIIPSPFDERVALVVSKAVSK